MSEWIQPWFHGDISRNTASTRLEERGEGCFLVRLSDTTPRHPFTVTFMHNRTKQNARIKLDKTETGFTYSLVSGDKCIVSSSKIGDIFKDNPLLKFPCPKEDNTDSNY